MEQGSATASFKNRSAKAAGIAQQLSQVSLGGDRGGNNIGRLIQRMLNFSTDFGALLVEVTEAMLRTSGGPDGRREHRPDGKTASHVHNGASTQLSVEIEGRGRSKVTLDLGAKAATGSLAASPRCMLWTARARRSRKISF